MPNTTISQKLKLLDAQVLNLFHWELEWI
jgi:hypothetical protein